APSHTTLRATVSADGVPIIASLPEPGLHDSIPAARRAAHAGEAQASAATDERAIRVSLAGYALTLGVAAGVVVVSRAGLVSASGDTLAAAVGRSIAVCIVTKD